MKKLSQIYEAAANTPNGFAILKPGFLDKKDEFMGLLKNDGWRIIKAMQIELTGDEAKDLYINKKDEPFYTQLCGYMSSGPCLACSLKKNCDDPIGDLKALKDKVRSEWGEDEMKNAMHSSDSLDNVVRECGICLNEAKCCQCKEAYVSDLGICDDANDIKALLKIAFAEEVLAWYQYIIAAPFLVGANRNDISEFFKEAADDELTDHAYSLLGRLHQLCGCSRILDDDIMNIENLNKIAAHKFIYPAHNTVEALRRNITAEKGAIATYTLLVEKSAGRDYVTHQLAKHILADEQEHLQKLIDLLNDALDGACDDIEPGTDSPKCADPNWGCTGSCEPAISDGF